MFAKIQFIQSIKLKNENVRYSNKIFKEKFAKI